MKGRINIENYEAYVIDFIEGNLDASLVEEMRAFLIIHPEIAEEVEEMQELEALEPAHEVSSMDLSSLKKSIESTTHINESNYEEVFAENADDVLPASVSEELETFLSKNDFLRKDYNLYSKAVLRPDEAVVFPSHGSLKRAIPLWENARSQGLRIAAVLIVALGGYTLLNILNNEVYMPRSTDASFVLMEAVSEPEQKTTTSTPVENSTIIEEANQEIATTESVQREMVPSQINRKSSSLPLKTNAQIEQRNELAYQPTISEWIPNESSSEEMNVGQYLGKQFLALEPEKTTTPISLLKETAKKVLDDREAITIEDKEEKQTFQFLASNFEFRRVNYK